MNKYKENKIGMVTSCIVRKPTEKGQSLEEMIRKATENNEPLDASAPMIYTEKAKGVMPEHDIRTDKFDLALDAVDKFQKSEIARKKADTEQSKDKTQESAQTAESPKDKTE